MQQLNLPYQLTTRRQAVIFDEFWEYTTTKTWTTEATAVGGESVAISATLLGGQIVFTTGGTQANQAGIYSTVKGFQVKAHQPMMFECTCNYVDANSHDCGIFLGFSDVLNATGASSALITNGTLTKASMTALGFAKLSTGTNWTVVSQATTTVTSNVTNIAADDGASSTFHVFRIEVMPISSTQADVVYKIDDQQVRDNTTGMPIKHTYVFNTTAMYAGIEVVAGSAHSQTPSTDYLCAAQLQRYNLV